MYFNYYSRHHINLNYSPKCAALQRARTKLRINWITVWLIKPRPLVWLYETHNWLHATLKFMFMFLPALKVDYNRFSKWDAHFILSRFFFGVMVLSLWDCTFCRAKFRASSAALLTIISPIAVNWITAQRKKCKIAFKTCHVLRDSSLSLALLYSILQTSFSFLRHYYFYTCVYVTAEHSSASCDYRFIKADSLYRGRVTECVYLLRNVVRERVSTSLWQIFFRSNSRVGRVVAAIWRFSYCVKCSQGKDRWEAGNVNGDLCGENWFIDSLMSAKLGVI
jgi:hypothetical protein